MNWISWTTQTRAWECWLNDGHYHSRLIAKNYVNETLNKCSAIKKKKRRVPTARFYPQKGIKVNFTIFTVYIITHERGDNISYI